MKKRQKLVAIMAGFLAFIMLFSLIVSIVPHSNAASSGSIKAQLKKLEEQADAIKAERAALSRQQAQNASETQDVVSRKKQIDQEIKLIHDEIDNITEQVNTYNELISEKQKELDDAQSKQEELNEQYKVRIRAMEEDGKVSYWSVLFKSKSFSDFLGNVSMIADIARADQAMMKELQDIAADIEAAKTELAEEKVSLEAQRSALADSQAELDAKSAEAAEVLDELIDTAADLKDQAASFAAQAANLSAQIAEKEKEYNAALKAEEEKRKQEEAAKQEQNQKPSGGGSGGSSGGGSSSSGWRYPLPYRVPITDPYGWRTNPITGKRSFHTGTDLAAGAGTSILATRSGTVTTAAYSDVWGYYVTINHGDGYSSLYAHMTRYTVSAGQSVSQGQTIGYVGSTGWSTGAHLHFTIYYNGNTVNPMNYV